MASNLPPGVTESMIPGNRPEDLANEEFWTALETRFKAEHPELDEKLQYITLSDDLEPAFVAVVEMARDMGYAAGVNEARIETEIERALEEER
jgi:hypothetical protein